MKKVQTLLFGALSLALAPVYADLARMGPVDTANGFPKFYQDNTGLALDLCLPNAQELINGSCLMLPEDIPNVNAPISFPNNFPHEAFWWQASAIVPLGSDDASLTLALEAAFANGDPVPNEQVVFSRIRYRFIAPETGTYTVQTPYSIDTFEATVGERVFNTLDIGINCPTGDFSCALKGKTSPFLRASNTPGGVALPPVTLPGGRLFLADPAIETAVTGGTVGNIFRITGPSGVLAETSQFSLVGRVRTDPIPSSTTLDRVTYTRNNVSSQIDIFATAIPGSGTPNLQIVGKGLSGGRLTADPNAPTKFHAQVLPNDASDLPINVTLINTTDSPTTMLTGQLTDLVTIKKARFSGNSLVVEAVSSDEISPPTLSVTGSNGVDYGDIPAGSTTGTFNAPVAPDNVIVLSSAGGRAALPVETNAVATAGSTIANDDNPLSADLGNINVLANDTVPVPSTGQTTVRIIQPPEHGTATVGSANIITYSPTGSYTGTDHFTYYIDNGNQGLSNVASVNFDVVAQNRSPVASPDTASVTLNGSVTIDVLANDSDPDQTPLIISNVTAPAAPASVSIVNNQIVFNAPSGTPLGDQTISYTITDGDGTTATSTITVTVQAVEIAAFNKAVFDTRRRTWQFDGTITPVPTGVTPVTIRFYAGAAAAVADETNFIGQALTDSTGRFRFDPTVSAINPNGNTFHIRTSRGTVSNFVHTIKN